MLSKLEDSDWGFVVYAPKTFKKATMDSVLDKVKELCRKQF